MTHHAQKIPAATYRVQLSADYTLWDLIGDLPFIHDLGVSHLYLSPVFESVPGSNHGYDVLDPTKISEERGGEEAFAELDDRLKKLGMEMILDIVPNHMAMSGANVYLADVMARGADSAYWRMFDFKVPKGEPVHLPVLGDPLEDVLDRYEIKIVKDASGKWQAQYWENIFPLSADTFPLCHADMTRDEIAALLERQHYRLVKWTETGRRIDYRRFFDISGLISLRMEDPHVFELYHRKLFEMTEQYGSICGVRIDHVDGMFMPGEYLSRLAEKMPHVWVEKILAEEESLPGSWPVCGTSGYEFIEKSNALLIDRSGFEAIEAFWKTLQPDYGSFRKCMTDAKKEALVNLFPVELKRVNALGGEGEDFWIEATAALPVYRTYVSRGAYEKADVEMIQGVAEATGIEAINERLSPEDPKNHEVLLEWQQLTGPVMAKGLEDTAHYRYFPLACCNEVGCEGEPGHAGRKQIEQWMNARGKRYPRTMNCTSTHDTKRSEDARARLMALADIPQEWIAFVGKARKAGVKFRSGNAPAPHAEYLYLQNLIASWPGRESVDGTYITRIKDYMTKAMREAKQETSWFRVDADYEQAVHNFVESALSDTGYAALVDEFAQRVSVFGAHYSLTVKVLQILAPGAPDIYRGAELWDLSLVDPDNRRPVDYDLRRQLLNDMDAAGPETLFKTVGAGAAKLWLIQKLLQIRAQYLTGLEDGWQIEFLEGDGLHAESLLGFCLKDMKGRVRLAALSAFRVAELPGESKGLTIDPSLWGGTLIALPDAFHHKTLRNLMTGQTIKAEGRKTSVAALLSGLPVGVFVTDQGS